MKPFNSINSSLGTRQTDSLPLPLPVNRAITKLGCDLALARRRRRMSQESLATRIGASLSTVKRMEKGDTRIPLLDTAKDEIGLTLADEQLPRRVRRKTRHTLTGAL
jgi:DNA-binding XRE family transcriptional regulator